MAVGRCPGLYYQGLSGPITGAITGAITGPLQPGYHPLQAGHRPETALSPSLRLAP